MKLFQVNSENYISVDSVSAVNLNSEFATVFTTQGVKHRITLPQARLLISCFEVIKPVVDVEESDSLTKGLKTLCVRAEV